MLLVVVISSFHGGCCNSEDMKQLLFMKKQQFYQFLNFIYKYCTTFIELVGTSDNRHGTTYTVLNYQITTRSEQVNLPQKHNRACIFPFFSLVHD